MFKQSCIFLLVCIFSFTPVHLFSKELIPGGENIGIKMDYEGVCVLSTYSFQANHEIYHPTKYLNSGDIIIEVNHQPVQTIQELTQSLSKQNNHLIPITIMRNHQKMDTFMYYIYDEASKTYMSGLYLQDSITGIGTVTFYDPSNHRFGALGHEILDHKGKSQSILQKGIIYESEIISLSKAKKGIPGEKQASILYQSKLGTVYANQSLGIFGSYEATLDKEKIETGTPVVGKAMIYTVLDKNKVEVFDIEITEVNNTTEKALTIKITDQDLLNQTGGIIQGMSGSPILQNGKLVGAVTHVLVKDPTRGYGIFIENMLEAAE